MPKVKLLEAEGDGGGHSGMNSIFTPEELAENAAADAQIEAEFELTLEERREIDAQNRALKVKDRRKAAYNRAYYQANREEIAAKQRAYREANREELAAKHRAYYQANREESAAYNRAY